MKLTVEQLREILNFNPETGLFTWKRPRRRCKVGDVAGSPHAMGYLQIGVAQQKFLVHRLAWFYVHGVWPPEQIDHIDGNRTNNAISNLRLASRSDNQCNRGVSRNNTTGRKGVRFEARKGLWRAEIQYRGERKWLGYFDNAEDASVAYQTAARELFGEFRRT